MRGAAEREFRAKRIEDGRTYSLAHLISYAVNDPRAMPKFDKVFPDGKPKRAQTADEMFALMREWVDLVGTGDGGNG